MKKVRVGLVGTGFAGRFHAQCLGRVYGVEVELAGVTSRRAESREKFAADHGTRVFPDATAMLDDIDVLDVCSPPYAHKSAILAAAKAGKGVICEKPLTGYFGPPGADATFHAGSVPKASMLREVLKSLSEIARVVRDNGVFFGYAENFVYTPSIQKEREIVEKTGSQILRMQGEESHNGSASPVYGIWRFAGGGALVGKACHPLTGILYLKQVEGIAHSGKTIRPVSVSARTHELTRVKGYRDAGLIRTDYHDIEDYGIMHLTFDDGTVADIMSCEVVLGGIYGYVEVFANNHRTRCHISPVNVIDTYNPKGDQYKDIYLIEKGSTKEGWSPAACDENFTIGYYAETQDFITCAATGTAPQSGLELALDTTAALYAAYVSAEKKGAEVAIPLV